MNQETVPHDYMGEAVAGESPVSDLEDRNLVQQIARRDEAAFAELYRRFSGSLFNFLINLLGDRPAAEDVLQEVFLAVWKGAGRYRGAAAVKTWLFNITYKQGVSWLRKRRELPVEDLDYLPDGIDPELALTGRRQNQDILQAMSQLSPQHRAVLDLVFYYDMSYEEAAEVLGCPLGTVKSRVSYARRQLATLLAIQELGADGKR